MGIYSSKQSLELRMTKKAVAKLSQDDGVPNDEVVELCCRTGDALVLSKIAQFYNGAHPITAPVGLNLLQIASDLYAIAHLYRRDPTYAKTYIDVTKSPEYKEAECIMNQLQTDSRCLYDNAAQPFIGAGSVHPTEAELRCAPQLFGSCYRGDL